MIWNPFRRNLLLCVQNYFFSNLLGICMKLIFSCQIVWLSCVSFECCLVLDKLINFFKLFSHITNSTFEVNDGNNNVNNKPARKTESPGKKNWRNKKCNILFILPKMCFMLHDLCYRWQTQHYHSWYYFYMLSYLLTYWTC